MKCPTCVAEGVRSRLTISPGMTTLMYSAPYYDEDGIYHSHDPNTTSFGWQCTEGHKGNSERGTRCPSCDWGNDPL